MYTLWLPALKACGLFTGFSDAEIMVLLSCFTVTSRKYRKGDVVCTAGRPQEHIGIVLAGEIHVQKEDYHGNRLIIGHFGPGEMFGEVSAFARTGQWPNMVLAGHDSTVLFMPYARIGSPCKKLCSAHPLLINNMLGIVAHKALIMNSRINYLKIKSMREKLATFLYEQYQRTGNRTFDISLNRDELADFLNVSRPSMSRELGRIRDLGLIDFYRSSFTIKDLEALRQLN